MQKIDNGRRRSDVQHCQSSLVQAVVRQQHCVLSNFELCTFNVTLAYTLARALHSSKMDLFLFRTIFRISKSGQHFAIWPKKRCTIDWPLYHHGRMLVYLLHRHSALLCVNVHCTGTNNEIRVRYLAPNHPNYLYCLLFHVIRIQKECFHFEWDDRHGDEGSSVTRSN